MTKRKTVRDDELLEIAEFVGIPVDRMRRFVGVLRLLGAKVELPRG